MAARMSDDELLDAAMEQFLELGLKRTTAEDICRAAGINRATLYRRIGDKDAVVRATLVREVSRFIDDIRGYVETFDTVEDRASHGFARAVMGLRQHPLFKRFLAGQEHDALAAMTIGSSPGLDLATAFGMSLIDEWIDEFGIRLRGEVEAVAALAARLIHSLALVPDAPPRLRTEEEVRDYARDVVVPLVLSTGPGWAEESGSPAS